jgi:hypothetical protein
MSRVAVLTIAAALLFGAQTASAQVDIDYACTPTPTDCNTWYRTPVTLQWFLNPRPDEGTVVVSGCVTQTISADTAGTPVWCEARFGADQVRLTKVLRVDRTAPLVTAGQPDRPPDGPSWYTEPVHVDFVGVDATSGIGGCTTATYAAPDSATASVSGTCIDVAGNRSAPLGYPLRFDSSGPTIRRGIPARRPDHGRWYRHPVRWRFKAIDPVSKVAGCTPVRYAGPDSPGARVIGTCHDKAGNVTTRAFPLRYDATRPARPRVRVRPRDGAVRLGIHVGRDVRSIAVVRAPGLGGTRDSTLYRGRPRGITDRRARNRRRYTYTVIARDRAANRARRHVVAVPGPRLIAPARGAVLSAPPRLAWTPVRRARYYNVQLWRGGRKVLSRWPSRAAYQLRATWRYAGRRRHLTSGTYRWDVWPGFGPRRRARYGRLVGSRSFVITAVSPAQ